MVFDHRYRFVIHGHDAISSRLDFELRGFDAPVMKTPVRALTGNAYSERLVGTILRQCLDFLIPLWEAQLKRILHEFIRHYNRGRPHSSLAWKPRTAPSRDFGRFTPTQAACRTPCQIDAGSWRAASRVWLGEAGSLATDRTSCGPQAISRSQLHPSTHQFVTTGG
jgi:transposase InsO family protein